MRCLILISTTLQYSAFCYVVLPCPYPCSAPCLCPHRIVLKSHCICNTFLDPSYWVSFEPVSQGVRQIWTLQLTVFFSSFLYSEWIQGEWQKLREGNCHRHGVCVCVCVCVCVRACMHACVSTLVHIIQEWTYNQGYSGQSFHHIPAEAETA